MRDKKDNATFDLPGFDAAPDTDAGTVVAEPKRGGPRARRVTLKQEQLTLLEETDASGLPVWTRDPNLDLSGLPIWQPE
jgi:predicted aldo/keto reductase-like oxidoreductase